MNENSNHGEGIMLKYLLAAVLLCSSGPTFATETFYTANDIMPGCRAYAAQSDRVPAHDTFSAGMCVGTMTALSRWADVCPPNGVTFEQAIRVIVAYIDARPARLHENFVDLAREALVAPWPCHQP
jgi:hypothetical protein